MFGLGRQEQSVFPGLCSLYKPQWPEGTKISSDVAKGDVERKRVLSWAEWSDFSILDAGYLESEDRGQKPALHCPLSSCLIRIIDF